MEKVICICGAGTMGRGIALAAVSRGLQTILYDLKPEILSLAESFIIMQLDRELAKKRISSAEKENMFSRILFTSRISDCLAPLIIEAIAEKTEAKSALFKELARINQQETLYATNTSSLSVTSIAEQTPFPEKIIGMHFFNPANRMELVEIIRTKYVSDDLITRWKRFAQQLGKTPVTCNDVPGFIVNRVARPFYLEALRLAEKNAADLAGIDRLMESAGFKMGPFHLMDLIGNDINYTVSSSLYESLGRPARLKPSVLQEDRVQKGMLGKKTGQGFFPYTKSAAE